MVPAPGSGGGLTGAAATGWWFGFGYFLAGLYWIGFAFLVDAPTFGWLLPIAVVGLPAGLAIFTAFGVALARLLWTRGALRILALAVALTASEWLRGHILTGFPWNAFGYALTAPLVLAQSAALIGIWGLTFLAVAIFASPATLFDDRSESRWPRLPLMLAAAVLIGLAAYGTVRLARDANPVCRGRAFAHHAAEPPARRALQLCRQATSAGPLHRAVRARGRAGRGNQRCDALDLAGIGVPVFSHAGTRCAWANRQAVARVDGADHRRGQAGRAGHTARYRRLQFDLRLDRDGLIVSTYDKLHLVPFGEYLPFQQFLESLGLQQLTKQRGGFSAGDRRRLLAVPGAPPALPLICYEIIFPGDVGAQNGGRGSGQAGAHGGRPGWMINVTNDGWFGISSGPYQHFQQARVRAIEEGLPLVRAANTGISAVVDPLGRIIEKLPLGAEGVIDAPLPLPIAAPLYAGIGDGPAAMMVAIALLLLLHRRLQPNVLKAEAARSIDYS